LAWRTGAERVLAEVDPGNVASRKVLLNNGFRRVDDRWFALDRPASW